MYGPCGVEVRRFALCIMLSNISAGLSAVAAMVVDLTNIHLTFLLAGCGHRWSSSS